MTNAIIVAGKKTQEKSGDTHNTYKHNKLSLKNSCTRHNFFRGILTTSEGGAVTLQTIL